MASIGGIRVKKIYPDATVPQRVSDGAVGYDVYAHNVQSRDDKRMIINDMSNPVEIASGEAVLFGIGVRMEIPWPYEAQVRPRSGLANKFDIELSNSPGTVDPDFRGEVGILLRNRGDKVFTVEKGMRIAQLIFSAVEVPQLIDVGESELLPTRRGQGGFGSTALYGTGMGTTGFDLEQARLDRYFMRLVIAASEMSDCIRGCIKLPDDTFERDDEGRFLGQKRRFGCIITKGLRVIATGFNRQHVGSPRCADAGCLRDDLKIPSGERIEVCRAIHAEQMAFNALMASGEPIMDATMYVNAEPCLICAKMIADAKLAGLNTLVILKGVYHNHGLDLVRNAGIIVREIELPK